MAKQPLGITFDIAPGQDPTGVYDDEDGVAVFLADDNYLLDDASSLQPPLPVFYAEGPVFLDSEGNAQVALAVSLIEEEPE